jgi:hypothetical protein
MNTGSKGIARSLLALGTVGLATMTGCATTPGTPAFRGTSGPVAWEVADIGQVVSPDKQRMRWSYTVVLRETVGSPIQFEHIERSSYSSGTEMIGSGVRLRPFRRRLEANSEIRLPFTESWGWARSSAASTAFGGAATISPLTVEYRFTGADGQARPITVVVRVRLDRSVGKVVKPLETTGLLPPAQTLRNDDLATVVGTWRGSYRATGSEFDIPVEFAIRADGSFEANENDPITNRYRGTLQIRDGKLAYAQRDDTGTLTLYKGAGKRFLAGHVSGQREDIAGAPPSTLSYTIRLESASPAIPASGVDAQTQRAAAQPSPSTSPTPSTLTGTYKGTVAGVQQGRSYTAVVSITLVQSGSQVSGTWFTVGGASGTMAGTNVGPLRWDLRVDQAHPCRASFTGTATASEDGSNLGGTYTGNGCAGPVNTSFTAVRQ